MFKKTYAVRTVAWIVVILLAVVIPATAFAKCQYCHMGSGEYGECYDVLDPDPSLVTYNSCHGIQQCFPYFGGSFCFPSCAGDACYWV